MSTTPLPDDLDPATRRRLERDFKDLRDEFTPILGANTVESCLQGCLNSLVVDARLNSFVPLLVQRFAREQLGAAAQNQGLLDKTVPEVLFVCTHDAGRSQMAAALLDHHAAGAVHVRTAGTNPSSDVNPVVAATLAQRHLNLSAAYAKPLTETVVRAADIVITLGCPDAVHTHPGQEHQDWDVADPEGKPADQVSAICDDLDRRITDLLAHLDQHQAQTS